MRVLARRDDLANAVGGLVGHRDDGEASHAHSPLARGFKARGIPDRWSNKAAIARLAARGNAAAPMPSQYQPTATCASSDMRSGVHGGSNTMLTSTSGDAFDGADGVLHPAGHLAGHRAAGRGQRHVDLDRCGRPRCRSCRSGRARRCRPEFPDRRPSSAPRRCRRSAAPARPAGMAEAGKTLRTAPRRSSVSVALLASSMIVHPKNFRAFSSASARTSTSARVLYMPNDARQVEVTPKRFNSGCAQWVPARTATPCAVDHHRHVMRVDALQLEGDDGALARRVAEDAQRVDRAQPLMRVGLAGRPRARRSRSRPTFSI